MIGILPNLNAQNTYLIEHFDYEAGALLRDHGWTSHSNPDTNPLAVSSEGLSMNNTAYIGNGIGRAALVINNGSDENKPLSSFIRQPEEGQPNINTYASFLMKPSGPIAEATGNTRPYFFFFGEYSDPENPDFTSVSTSFRARTFIYPGTVPNTFRLNLSFNQNVPGDSTLTGNFSSDETHLIVLKYTSIPGADNDDVSMYVFKDGDDISAEPATPTIGPIKGANRDIIVQSVGLRQYLDGQNVIVDGIVVKDDWDWQGTPSSLSYKSEEATIKIFPNPVQEGVINVVSSKTATALARIYDTAGRLVSEKVMSDTQIDVSTLNKGIYFLNIIQNEQLYTQKLIVY